MSGLKSRNKGMRREYEVRDYFRSLGFEAHRIPASGASQGFKGDVEVRTETSKFTVEVKSRKSSFKWLYRFYAEGLEFYKEFCIINHVIAPNTAYHFAIDTYLVSLSSTFEDVSFTHKFYSTRPKYSDTISNRFKKLNEMRAEAKYLVIKDDNKPFLFLSFE